MWADGPGASSAKALRSWGAWPLWGAERRPMWLSRETKGGQDRRLAFDRKNVMCCIF